MIITIDGPIATGKSTLARKLAEELGYIYFDTGAMYRCLTYGILHNHINADDEKALENYLKDFVFDIKMKKGERRYYLAKEDVTDKIRMPEVTGNVSRISAIKLVREKLTSLQKSLAYGVNAVFEGRDMGTTVFPHADLKIFLTGRPEVRAKRRFDELKKKYPEEMKSLTFEQCLDDISKRDEYDTSRKISPLKKAEDAYVIDTSDLTVDQIIQKILEYRDAVKMQQKQHHR